MRGGNNCKLLQIAPVACLTIFYKIRTAKFSQLDCSFSACLGSASLFPKRIAKVVIVIMNTGKTQFNRRMQICEKQIGQSGGSKDLLVVNICGFYIQVSQHQKFRFWTFPKNA